MRILIVAVIVSACAGAPAVSSPPRATTQTTASPVVSTPRSTTTSSMMPRLDNYVETENYGAGVLDVYSLPGSGDRPVVVLVHGGGWVSGDRSDLERLANELANRGVVVFNASYRTLEHGGGFPSMMDDVACALATARILAPAHSTRSDITLVGFSAGAHLAAVVALSPGVFGADCPTDTAAGPEAFIGLAGPYDITAYSGLLDPLFGVSLEDGPEVWKAANPIALTEDAPALAVLLLIGSNDELIPTEMSRRLAEALPNARLVVIEGETHAGMSEPVVVNDLIIDFIGDLS